MNASNTRHNVYLKIVFFLLLLPAGALSQSDTLWTAASDTLPYSEEAADEEYAPYSPPPLEPLNIRRVDKAQWAKAVRELDYSKDRERPQKQKKTQAPGVSAVEWTSATQDIGSFLQMVAIVLAVAGIAYGIYRMLKAPRNRLIAHDGVEITLRNLDEYLHETDLDRFLREALEKKDYTSAIRIYYLQIIKSLSDKNAIVWSREKTNRDYLRETRDYRLGDAFHAVTRAYERIWYGNQPLSAADYARLEPRFKNLLTAI